MIMFLQLGRGCRVPYSYVNFYNQRCMSAGGHRLSQKSLGKSDEPTSPQPLLIGDTPTPPPSISLISIPFDTYATINELQKMGFTEVQSKGLVAILVHICLQQNDRVLVQPRDVNVLELQIKRDMEQIKRDMEQISHNQTLLEKSSISQMRDLAKKLEEKIKELKVLLKDEVKKVENGAKLDINLERGRNKENEMLLEQKIKHTHNMINTEVALLKVTMETNKLDLIIYITGAIFTIVTVMISVVSSLPMINDIQSALSYVFCDDIRHFYSNNTSDIRKL